MKLTKYKVVSRISLPESKPEVWAQVRTTIVRLRGRACAAIIFIINLIKEMENE